MSKAVGFRRLHPIISLGRSCLLFLFRFWISHKHNVNASTRSIPCIFPFANPRPQKIGPGPAHAARLGFRRRHRIERHTISEKILTHDGRKRVLRWSYDMLFGPRDQKRSQECAFGQPHKLNHLAHTGIMANHAANRRYRRRPSRRSTALVVAAVVAAAAASSHASLASALGHPSGRRGARAAGFVHPLIHQVKPRLDLPTQLVPVWRFN